MKISARFLLIFAVVAAATIVALHAGQDSRPSRRERFARADRARRGVRRTCRASGIRTHSCRSSDRREYGTRATMTEEEHAKALAELQERNKRPGRDSREVAGKPAIGTEKDVARAYNEFWFGDKPTKLSYAHVDDHRSGRTVAFRRLRLKRPSASLTSASFSRHCCREHPADGLGRSRRGGASRRRTTTSIASTAPMVLRIAAVRSAASETASRW